MASGGSGGVGNLLIEALLREPGMAQKMARGFAESPHPNLSMLPGDLSLREITRAASSPGGAGAFGGQEALMFGPRGEDRATREARMRQLAQTAPGGPAMLSNGFPTGGGLQDLTQIAQLLQRRTSPEQPGTAARRRERDKENDPDELARQRFELEQELGRREAAVREGQLGVSQGELREAQREAARRQEAREFLRAVLAASRFR